MRKLLPLGLVSLLAFPAHAAEQGIELAVTVKAPVAEVWKAWTTSQGISSFFAPEALVEARPDGAFHIIIDPYAPSGLQGADDMKVLAVEQERMLSFTWNAPPHLPQARQQRTVVVLRFAPQGETTQLTLSHLGWGSGGEWPKARAYFEKAWPNVLKQLQTRFETGKPQDWTAWREQLKQWHASEAAKPKP
ncbi:SRPBCC domain-containing protein [Chitinimonas arctica]|uniref:SRPBCC domain-containing protein n=1 Tax=Chitinimonas arctica TaxID=2594795 RepID=A0A516SDL3_9NEIS|nr:SRPBCC domain-containing protein [Chitinimonas arctica]QDQ26231.1 SRPBCC domain-containing protein [Chitinimonas arctica]